MLSIIKKHPWVSSVVAIVATVQVFELILMVRMYGMFSKTFLQPYSIESFSDRAFFISGSLYSDFFLYGILALGFYLLALKFKRSHHTMAYHYFFVTMTISLMLLIAKYKALSYMSDTINFTIAKNIAGGSLLSALKYVAHEAAIIGIIMVGALITYWLGFRFIIKPIVKNIQIDHEVISYKSLLIKTGIAVCILVIFSAILKYDANVRYGVIKKSSYKVLLAGMNQISDLDRDGYGFFAVPEDHAHFDSNIHPGAVDIPGNGIDEDTLFGDFIYEINESKLSIESVEPQYKYVFLIILESARGDMMTTTLEGRHVAPNIQKMAQKGTEYPNVYSHTGFTATSLKALFNGSLIPSRNQSLFQLMQTLGYKINVFSGQAEDFGNISGDTGMELSSSVFFDASSNIEKRVYPSADLGSLTLSEETVVEGIQSFMNNDMGDEQQFFYINFQAAHFPYDHPGMPRIFDIEPIPRNKISAENKEWLKQTYWNSIAVADDAVGQLVATLEQLGIYDETLFIISSDHGESLFDDGVLGHGHRINDNQLKIPLVLNVPQTKLTAPLGQTDLRYLILDTVGGDEKLTKTNSKLKERPAVFHLIGEINSPVQISHTYEDERIIFDFRTRMVMFETKQQWQAIDELVEGTPEYLKLMNLVFTWEEYNYLENGQFNE